MTNFDFEAANAAYAEKYAAKAVNAQKRASKLVAFMAAHGADFCAAYDVKPQAVYRLCDKTAERFVQTAQAMRRGAFVLKNDRDLQRFVVNLVLTLEGARAAKANVGKADILATAKPAPEGATVAEYVTSARRIVDDSTAERQTGIAEYVLAALGVLEREKDGALIVRRLNTKAKAWRPLLKAAQNARFA